MLILSEITVNHAGVEVEISLKMFHLQRQKHFVSRRLFPGIISCLLLIALEVKLTELEKLPLPFSTSFFIHGYCCVLCIDYRLLLFQYCKYIRPPVTALAPKQSLCSYDTTYCKLIYNLSGLGGERREMVFSQYSFHSDLVIQKQCAHPPWLSSTSLLCTWLVFSLGSRQHIQLHP